MSSRRSSVLTVSHKSSISYLSVSETDDHNDGVYQRSHPSTATSSAHTFGTIPKYLSPPPISPTPSLASSTWTSDSRSIFSGLDAESIMGHDVDEFGTQPSLAVPCTCTFRPTGYGAMGLYVQALLPSEDDPLLYRIGVSPNCFLPTSFVTTVERGRTSELVATFEIGPSRDPPILYMDNILYPLLDVFSDFRVKVKSRGPIRRIWERGSYKLHWGYETDHEAVCHRFSELLGSPLARLTSAAAAYPAASTSHADPRHGHATTPLTKKHTPTPRPPRTKLKIFVDDRALLDEIVVSALVLERTRLMPGWEM